MVLLWYYNGNIIGGTKENNWRMNSPKSIGIPFLLVSALCKGIARAEIRKSHTAKDSRGDVGIRELYDHSHDSKFGSIKNQYDTIFNCFQIGCFLNFL